jgi:hypothetical protein
MEADSADKQYGAERYVSVHMFNVSVSWLLRVKVRARSKALKFTEASVLAARKFSEASERAGRMFTEAWIRAAR